MYTVVKIYTVPLKRKQLSGTCSAVIMLRHPKIIIAYMVGSAVQIDTDGVCNVEAYIPTRFPLIHSVIMSSL
jgi:hypothetical protein